MSLLLYPDSAVLITAAKGLSAQWAGDRDVQAAVALLSDPSHRFASSVYLQLEVLPKLRRNKQASSVRFHEEFFAAVTRWATDHFRITTVALDEASRLGLSALDAIHLAAAASVDADYFVTFERRSSPLHANRLVPVMKL